ncbi:MAG: MmcQ/YjbR family DNA-binding protein [Terriglobales bacterium]
MDLDNLRAYCLSFAGTSEGLQWGDALLFRVANKIFVTVSLGDVPPRFTVKCTPERCAEMLEVDGIRRAPYVGKHGWVEVKRIDLLPDEEMRELIAASYENVRRKLPKTLQAKLDGERQSGRAKARTARRRRSAIGNS